MIDKNRLEEKCSTWNKTRSRKEGKKDYKKEKYNKKVPPKRAELGTKKFNKKSKQENAV